MDNSCNNVGGGLITESTLETIDTAFYNWVVSLDISCQTKNGKTDVPILWASAERSFQVKNRPDLRDENGMMKYPVISIQRTGTEKSLTRRIGIPNTLSQEGDGRIQVAKKINQRKSRNYAEQQAKQDGIYDPQLCNNKVVYDVYSSPIPVFVNVNYKITFRTEYQQQMNSITTPFITFPGGINEFMISHNKHSYPVFVQESISSGDNVTSFTEEERKFERSIDFKVLGYLIGGDNSKTPLLTRKETIVEVQMPRERIMHGALDDFEALYSKSAIDRFAAQCCPQRRSGLPERFGRFSEGEVSIQGSSGGGGNVNIIQVEQVVDDRVVEILVVREFLAGVGGGNLDFAASNTFKIESESLYINGVLQYPGAGNDYVVWDGSEPNKPALSGVTLTDHRPPPDGIGIDPDWDPPQTAAEKGHIVGENDGIYDDILLLSYIKA